MHSLPVNISGAVSQPTNQPTTSFPILRWSLELARNHHNLVRLFMVHHQYPSQRKMVPYCTDWPNEMTIKVCQVEGVAALGWLLVQKASMFYDPGRMNWTGVSIKSTCCCCCRLDWPTRQLVTKIGICGGSSCLHASVSPDNQRSDCFIFRMTNIIGNPVVHRLHQRYVRPG